MEPVTSCGVYTQGDGYSFASSYVACNSKLLFPFCVQSSLDCNVESHLIHAIKQSCGYSGIHFLLLFRIVLG